MTARLPAVAGYAEFDALHDRPARWHAPLAALAATLGARLLQQHADGTVLVGSVSGGRILKLYPPFLADHQRYEVQMLALLHGRLSLPTPQLLDQGVWQVGPQGWPWTLMHKLPGRPLTAAWPRMTEPQRCALLHALGTLVAQVQALPLPAALRAAAPRWGAFIGRQRAGCLARQQRTGLPAHLLAQVPAFVAGPLPGGAHVALTGEYTPMNLLVRGPRLAGMYDFGDGLVGPRGYDWLGPLCFLAAGQAPRVAAFFGGLGERLTPARRLALLRLLLLHRYSGLPAQIRGCDGWQRSPTLAALAERLWPLA